MNKLSKGMAIAAGIAGASYATYVATTFLRYGKPRRAKGDAADPLLDTFMPTYDVYERHHRQLEAPASAAFAAAKELRFDDSRMIRAIFRGRELFLRSKPGAAERTKPLLEFTQAIGWRILAEVPDREIVVGAVTKPWEPNPEFRPVPPEEFAAFAEPDYVKIVWTLRAEPRPDGGSTFWTETRAVATDAGARKKFRLYWSLLSPGIILIREAMLPMLHEAADRKWHIEGDDLLAEAAGQLTHATTIAAPPSDVWPWLVQMGGQRAGWYSWDRLDNGGKRSADRIIPDLQHLAVGDVLPARPKGSDGFKVLRIIPERALIVGGVSPDWEGTWAFVLEPLADGKTRLITRYRAAYAPNVKMAVMLPLYAAVHSFMEGKQLRTIKDHAEHMHAHVN